MKSVADKRKALQKLAYGPFAPTWSPTVGVSYPEPNVSNVLNAIGVAQARDIGTPKERRDAFGKIINSGLVNTSPAATALKMVGRGMLGRNLVGLFTNNPFAKGLAAGFGAVSALDRY